MKKTELTSALHKRHAGKFSHDRISEGVSCILSTIVESLEAGERVEIRGFGNFTIRHWGPRFARHPLSGETWRTPPMRIVHFKVGKELNQRINSVLTVKDSPC